LLQKNGVRNELDWSLYDQGSAKHETLGGVVLTDTHFDLLDIKANSLKSRLDTTSELVKRTLERVMKFEPDKILVANIGDMWNSDGRYRTTSGKVTMQNNSMEQEAFKRVLEWLIEFLEKVQNI